MPELNDAMDRKMVKSVLKSQINAMENVGYWRGFWTRNKRLSHLSHLQRRLINILEIELSEYEQSKDNQEIIEGQGVPVSIPVTIKKSQNVGPTGWEISNFLPKDDFTVKQPEGTKWIFDLAKSNGWRCNSVNQVEKKIRFSRNQDDIIDIWYSKMTVGTIVTHPKRGRAPLFRRRVDSAMMAKLFKNPREHTAAGYYKR